MDEKTRKVLDEIAQEERMAARVARPFVVDAIQLKHWNVYEEIKSQRDEHYSRLMFTYEIKDRLRHA